MTISPWPIGSHLLLAFVLSAMMVAVQTHAVLAQADASPPASAPERRTPEYQKLRYDEDYSYLRNPPPDLRSDFWDPIKFIPFNSNGNVYLSFGGEARERFEYYHNFRWNPEALDQDGY